MIKIDDIIAELVANTFTPSSFGSILEKAQAQMYVDGNYKKLSSNELEENEYDGVELMRVRAPLEDVWQQLSNIEHQFMQKAPVYRALTDLSKVPQFTPLADYPVLNKLQKKVYNDYTQGAIAIYVLKIFHTWFVPYRPDAETCEDSKGTRDTNSENLALTNIYVWMNSHGKYSKPQIQQLFAQGQLKKSKDTAKNLYSDCLVAISDHLEKWNREERRKKEDKKLKFENAKKRLVHKLIGEQ